MTELHDHEGFGEDDGPIYYLYSLSGDDIPPCEEDEYCPLAPPTKRFAPEINPRYEAVYVPSPWLDWLRGKLERGKK